MPDTQHITVKAIETFDGIYSSVVPSGKQPKGISGLHDVTDGIVGRNILDDTEIRVIECIPCHRAHDSVRRKIQCLLESSHGLLRPAAKDSVLGKRRNAGIKFRGDVQEILKCNHVLSPGSLAQDAGWRCASNPKGVSFAV